MPPNNSNFEISLLAALLIFLSVLLVIVSIFSVNTTLPSFLEDVFKVILGGLLLLMKGRDGKREDDPRDEGRTVVNQVSTTRKETVSEALEHGK